MQQIRPIAIYLPQFHPIPENDKWWGKGFTEWTNVARAKPLFKGHYQPHLPADLGFYDLRLIEVMEQQAMLAKTFGISGFCFYHYWFNGKLLLETPIHNMLESKSPDFPFMLCWANENWTRRWDGMENEILMQQNYNEDDDKKHFDYLLRFFQDPRYIKVNGKPVFIVYKHFLLPDATAFTERLRRYASAEGMELYLCHMSFGYHVSKNQLVNGFDAAIDFEPFGIRRNDIFKEIKTGRAGNLGLMKRALAKVFRAFERQNVLFPDLLNKIPYAWMSDNLESLKKSGYKIYPSVVPGWDNTARRGRHALILDKSTPELFGRWLAKLKDDFVPYSKEENFLFINAWNEWAEGNHLEPCAKWGSSYLQQVKKHFYREA